MVLKIIIAPVGIAGNTDLRHLLRAPESESQAGSCALHGRDAFSCSTGGARPQVSLTGFSGYRQYSMAATSRLLVPR
jgi:hypothetical protein